MPKVKQPATSAQTVMQFWSAKAAEKLKGRRIVEAEYRKNENHEIELWVFLDSGAAVIPLADDEGNGPGALELVQADGLGTVLPQLRDGDDVRAMPRKDG